jgi:hypothetical protein
VVDAEPRKRRLAATVVVVQVDQESDDSLSLLRAAGQCVDIREVDEHICLVSFMDYDLGFFDQDEGRVEPRPDPFGPERVLTMSPE